MAVPPFQSHSPLRLATVPVMSERGGGSGCASIWPPAGAGCTAATLLLAGCEAKGLEREPSLKRAMSLLQAPSPDAIKTIGASRINPRERHDLKMAPMMVLADHAKPAAELKGRQ